MVMAASECMRLHRILGKTARLAGLGGSEAKEGRMWHQAELQRGKNACFMGFLSEPLLR